MKMSPDNLATLRELVAPLDTPDRRDAYRTGNFPRADRVDDLNVRYRWDCMWAATHTDRSLYSVLDGLDSAHIDTALRSFIAPLEDQ